MEASALRHAARVPVLTGLSPHLRLQSDERLVALVRRGHQGAFEVLLKRYQPRLLAFCRHMLGSNEDAEDVLQEVFSSAYNAICADERPINARPWLYRIARNRCLNHLRRPQDAGQESMDFFEREAGATAADTVHGREEFRQVVADVHDLPETQRTALLLREIDTLSYEQIADAMETTVPSIKSLLVRARMSLAEASEARQLTCAEVRLQLTQAAEGILKASAPTRRHARSCPRCRSFKRELRKTSHALAAVGPVGPAVAVKALLTGGSAGTAAGKGAAGGSAVAGGTALAGGGAAGMLSATGGSVVTKAAAGLVAATLVTVGAVEVRGGGNREESPPPAPAVQPADDRGGPPAPVAAGHDPSHRPAVAPPAAPAAGPTETPAVAAEPSQEQAPTPPETAVAPVASSVASSEEHHTRPSTEADEAEPSSQALSPSDPGAGDFPSVIEVGSDSSGSSGSSSGSSSSSGGGADEAPPGGSQADGAAREGTTASGSGGGSGTG